MDEAHNKKVKEVFDSQEERRKADQKKAEEEQHETIEKYENERKATQETHG